MPEGAVAYWRVLPGRLRFGSREEAENVSYLVHGECDGHVVGYNAAGKLVPSEDRRRLSHEPEEDEYIENPDPRRSDG